MALLSSEYSAGGTEVEIEFSAGKRIGATVVPLPFYKRPK